jgi:hypothetical protein
MKFERAQWRQAKEFLKDAKCLGGLKTPTFTNLRWQKPDGSVWFEGESLLESPEDDYSLELID